VDADRFRVLSPALFWFRWNYFGGNGVSHSNGMCSGGNPLPRLHLALLTRYLKTGLFAALFCMLLTPVAARAEDGDIVHFSQNIVVHEGEEARDVVCFLCSIEVDGTVHRDMVAFLGNIHVRGHAEHDAVAFLGNVTLGDNASIDHDVVVFAGSLHLGSGATVGNDRVVFPLFLFVLPLLLFAGIVALIIWALRALLSRNRPVYPMPPPR